MTDLKNGIYDAYSVFIHIILVVTLIRNIFTSVLSILYFEILVFLHLSRNIMFLYISPDRMF